MTNTSRFIAKSPPPFQPDGVAYEPFPVDGEPLYANHPAFKYDESLKLCLDGYHLLLAVMVWKMKIQDPSLTVEGEMKKGKMKTGMAWLRGEIPIPAQHVEAMMERRAKWLRKHDLPLDTPIGFQHPDFVATQGDRDSNDGN